MFTLRCCRCKGVFSADEAVHKRICLESEYGVASMFPNRTYEDIMMCPWCGSEDLEDYDGEEEADV